MEERLTSKGGFKKLVRWSITIVIVGLIIYGIARAIIRDWPEIVAYDWKIEWGKLIVSVFLASSGNLLNTKVMQRLVKAFGGEIDYPRFAFIFTISNFGRYVPGKVAQIAGQVLLLKREGVRKTVSLTSAVVFQGMLVLVGGILGILLVGSEVLSKVIPSVPDWAIYILAIVGFIMTIPGIMEKVINRGFKLIKREPIVYNLSFRDWFVAVIALTVGWSLLGLGFAVMTDSLTTGPLNYPYACGTFMVAYLVGWLILIAPGGLGVREGVIMLFLTGIFTSGIAGIVAAAARLWLMLVEFAILGIAAGIFKFSGGKISGFLKVKNNTETDYEQDKKNK